MVRTFVVSAEIAPWKLSYREEVELACAPANARWDQAWGKYVDSTALAKSCNQVSLAFTERAVRHANLARQLLTIARLQGTVPLYEAPEVSTLCRLKQAIPSAERLWRK